MRPRRSRRSRASTGCSSAPPTPRSPWGSREPSSTRRWRGSPASATSRASSPARSAWARRASPVGSTSATSSWRWTPTRRSCSPPPARRSAMRAGACRPPHVDEVAHRDDPDDVALAHHDEVTEAPLGHPVGGLLEVPVAVGEHGGRGEVVLDLLAVRVVAAPERPHDVALRDDPGTWLLGIEDHGGTDVVLAHELRRLAQRAPRCEREHVLRHRVVDLHPGSSPFTSETP